MNQPPEEPSPAAVRKRRQRRRGLPPARRLALDYAAKLSKLADEAPDAAARSELYKIIDRLRKRHSHNIKTVAPKLLHLLRSVDQPYTARDLAEDSGYPLGIVIKTIDVLVKHGKVTWSTEGGRRNAGRNGSLKLYSVTPPT